MIRPSEIYISIDCAEPEAAEYGLRILLSPFNVEVIHLGGDTPAASITKCLISYGSRLPDTKFGHHIHILETGRLWTHYRKPESLPSLPLQRIPLSTVTAETNTRLADPLVVPFAESSRENPLDTVSENRDRFTLIVKGVDIIASAFFWISRYEEVLIEKRDEFDRIPEEELIAVREKITARPLVDEYSELLYQWMERVGIKLERKRSRFRVVLSHDIDSDIQSTGSKETFYQARRFIYDEIIRNRRLKSGISAALHWSKELLRLRDNETILRKISEIDREYGFTPHFFMMANGTHQRDAAYDIFSPETKRAIEAIINSGGAIGLHCGLDSHQSAEQLKTETVNLKKAVPDRFFNGVRCHYLKFFVPLTWRMFEEMGFHVDSTLGFSNFYGFRCGTCHPFKPFDIDQRRVFNIWEYPLILMDKCLITQKGYHRREILSQVKELIATVRSHSGCLIINWHNVFFFGYPLRLYREILTELEDAEDEDIFKIR